MRFMIILFGVLMFWSCSDEQNNTNKKPGKEVQEIKVSNKISDIIRNPVDADGDIDTVNVAKLVFEDKRFDFGTVNEGDIVRHTYRFSNEGKAPLIITEAKATCGCTVAEYPEEAIAPGGKGEISVRFDTKNKPGDQRKPITISANTYPRKTYLQLRGQVIPKE